MGGRLLDWLGSGDAASRPDAATMVSSGLIVSGSTAFYFATDTKILSIWDEGGSPDPVWFEVDIAAVAALAFATMSDVDLTGVADNDILVWDTDASNVIPLTFINGTGTTVDIDPVLKTIAIDGTVTQYTDEMAQDAVAAAIAAGTHVGITPVYDDPTNTLSFEVSATYVDGRADARIAAASIGDLSDVDITTTPPINGDSLVWDTDHFEPGASSSVNAIDDLSDVDTSTTPPTDGQALIWDDTGSQWIPGDGAGGADSGHWHRIAVYTPSAAAQVDVAIPADATAVRLVCGLACSSDGADLFARVTTDNFATVKTGATDYKFAETRSHPTNSQTATVSDGGSSIRLASAIGNAAGEEFIGEIGVQLPRDAAFPTSFVTHHSRLNASGQINLAYGGGRYNTAEAVNGVRIYPSAGTLTGKVYVYVFSADAAAAGGSGDSGWQLIETLSPSAVASIASADFNALGYKDIQVICSLTTDTDANSYFVRFKLNGTVQSGASYSHGNWGQSGSGSSNTTANANGTATGIVFGGSGATWGIGNAAGESLDCELLIPAIDSAREKRIISRGNYDAPSGAAVSFMGGGVYSGTDNTAALQGLSFHVTSGTMTGTIRIYGRV